MYIANGFSDGTVLLGGPVEEHVRDMQLAVRHVRLKLNEAKQMLIRRNCRGALSAIAGAIERYGSVVSFRRAAGMPMQDASTQALLLEIGKLRVEAAKKCVR